MKSEIIDKFSALITSAFGLVAALAWNDTIRKIVDLFFKETGNISAMITYAIIVTIIAVTLTLWIGNVAGKAKDIQIKESLKKIKPKKSE